MSTVTATPHSTPDPLAALPLLMEAGVSVYWRTLDGRTAWMADAETREVWLSRAIPRDAVLGSLIQALQVIDDGAAPAPAEAPAPGLELVHSADRIERRSRRTPPALRVVRDA